MDPNLTVRLGCFEIAKKAPCLLLPFQRKRLQQNFELEFIGLPPVQDRLKNVRREQRQAQDAAHVAAVDAFPSRQLLDRPTGRFFQQPLPLERPRKRLYERVVGPRPRPLRGAVGCDNLLPPTAVPKRHRYVDRDRLAGTKRWLGLAEQLPGWC